MKLATLKCQKRDGQLVVVSRDLKSCVAVPDIAPTLQYALDHWQSVESLLQEVYRGINHGDIESQGFASVHCESPLPRAYHRADACAYLYHVELMLRARGIELPESLVTEPVLTQCSGDHFLGPGDNIAFARDDWGVDFKGEIAVITGELPMGASLTQAQDAIRLVMLGNSITLRELLSAELSKGFGLYQAVPCAAFSPVAVTPDELADNWYENKLHTKLHTSLNQVAIGALDTGKDMTFDFADLIVHACRSRPLGAGSIVGSGVVSNRPQSLAGSALAEGGSGYACIAEQRMTETLISGEPRSPFLKFGDNVRLEVFDNDGYSLFGAIEQQVSRYQK